jgi:hypothetical protein
MLGMLGKSIYLLIFLNLNISSTNRGDVIGYSLYLFIFYRHRVKINVFVANLAKIYKF